MKKIEIYCWIGLLCFLAIAGCRPSNTKENASTTTGQLALPADIISAEEAKEVIAKYIQESDDYQKLYTVGSLQFDSRVSDISWGDPILVRILPDGTIYLETSYYYVLTGILSDGQVLAAQTVNAQTGKRMEGALFTSETADVIRMATPTEAISYSRSLLSGDLVYSAVYYFDGTPQTTNKIFSWKYLIETQPKARSLNGNTGIYIDPWIQNFRNNNSLTNKNAFFSRINYFHRAFVMDNTIGEKGITRSLSVYKPLD